MPWPGSDLGCLFDADYLKIASERDGHGKIGAFSRSAPVAHRGATATIALIRLGRAARGAPDISLINLATMAER